MLLVINGYKYRVALCAVIANICSDVRDFGVPNATTELPVKHLASDFNC